LASSDTTYSESCSAWRAWLFSLYFRDTGSWPYLFFALAVAGLYTLVAAPAACCLYLWTRREWLNGILFGAALTACLAAAFLYGNTSPRAPWRIIFSRLTQSYSVSQLGSLVQALLRGYSLLFLLSAVMIWKSFQEKEISLILLYWLLAAGTTLSLGKIGAAQNHELQLIFATCIGAAVAYEWMRRNSSGDWGLALVLALSSWSHWPTHLCAQGKPIDASASVTMRMLR